MSDKNKQLEATFGMAVMDAVPVIFFAAAMLLIGTAFSNPLYLSGAVLCTFAGLGKVLWKLILAGKKKDVHWLFTQFRVTMPLGFTLILLSMFVYRKQINWSFLGKCFSHPVGIILFGLGFLLMAAMFVLAVKLDPNVPKSNWIEQTVNTFAQFFILCGVALFVYAGTYYPAGEEALLVLKDSADSGNEVSITKEKGYYFFDGSGNDKAMVFYPGALVEYTAYAPLMKELAGAGIDCFLVEMPYGCAFFGINKADALMEAYDYPEWYMGGHSLGGAMASTYASKHEDKLKGAVLLASYSTADISSLKVVSVYGDRDNVLNRKNYEKYRNNLPGDCSEHIISGGNHAGFADYGHQKGDNDAAVSSRDQVAETVKAVTDSIAK